MTYRAPVRNRHADGSTDFWSAVLVKQAHSDDIRGPRFVVARKEFNAGDVIMTDQPFAALRVMTSQDGTPSPFAHRFAADPATGHPQTAMPVLLAECLLLRGVTPSKLRELGMTQTIHEDAIVFGSLIESGALKSAVKAISCIETDPSRAKALVSEMVRVCLAYGVPLTVHATPQLRSGMALFDSAITWCNNACSPNARFVTNDTGEVSLVALTHISAEDEITVPHNICISVLDIATRPVVLFSLLGVICHCRTCIAESYLLQEYVCAILEARDDKETAVSVRSAKTPMETNPGLMASMFKKLLPINTTKGDPTCPMVLNSAPVVTVNSHNFAAVCNHNDTTQGWAHSAEVVRSKLSKMTRRLPPDMLAEELVRALEDLAPLILSKTPDQPLFLDNRLLWQLYDDLITSFLLSDPTALAKWWETPCDSAASLQMLSVSELAKAVSTPLGHPGQRHTSPGGYIDDVAREVYVASCNAKCQKGASKKNKKNNKERLLTRAAALKAFTTARKKTQMTNSVTTISMVFMTAMERMNEEARRVATLRGKLVTAKDKALWPVPCAVDFDTHFSVGLVGAYCLRYQILLNVGRNVKGAGAVDPVLARFMFTQLSKFSTIAQLSGLMPMAVLTLMEPGSQIAGMIRAMSEHMVKVVSGEDWKVAAKNEKLYQAQTVQADKENVAAKEHAPSK
jgi:hypothetical protein